MREEGECLQSTVSCAKRVNQASVFKGGRNAIRALCIATMPGVYRYGGNRIKVPAYKQNPTVILTEPDLGVYESPKGGFFREAGAVRESRGRLAV